MRKLLFAQDELDYLLCFGSEWTEEFFGMMDGSVDLLGIYQQMLVGYCTIHAQVPTRVVQPQKARLICSYCLFSVRLYGNPIPHSADAVCSYETYNAQSPFKIFRGPIDIRLVCMRVPAATALICAVQG